MINTRNQIPNLLHENSVGCELGVFEGDFSKILIQSNKFTKLFLVDVFSGKASNFCKVYEDSSVLENQVKNRFKEYSYVEVIKNDSLSFLKSIPDNSLDFIYIDTVHSYDQTQKELQESYRTIKNGGLICGHDYCEMFSGVIQAVQEFISQHNFKLRVTHEPDFASFIIYTK